MEEADDGALEGGRAAQLLRVHGVCPPDGEEEALEEPHGAVRSKMRELAEVGVGVQQSIGIRGGAGIGRSHGEVSKQATA